MRTPTNRNQTSKPAADLKVAAKKIVIPRKAKPADPVAKTSTVAKTSSVASISVATTSPVAAIPRKLKSNPAHPNSTSSNSSTSPSRLLRPTSSFISNIVTPPSSVTMAPVSSVSVSAVFNVPAPAAAFGSRLAALGITAAAPTNGLSAKTEKDSKLKAVIVQGGGEQTPAIVFRLEPRAFGSKTGSWAEKIFHDAVKSSCDWVQDYGIYLLGGNWHHENVPQVNPKNYGIRLFCINCLTLPTREQVLVLGRELCVKINQYQNNDTTTTVETEGFFWLDQPVWSDIIGCDNALSMLLRICSDVENNDEYFNTHRPTINTFFHQGTLSHELASILKAPDTELHPSLQANDVDSLQSNHVASTPRSDTIVLQPDELSDEDQD